MTLKARLDKLEKRAGDRPCPYAGPFAFYDCEEDVPEAPPACKVCEHKCIRYAVVVRPTEPAKGENDGDTEGQD